VALVVLLLETSTAFRSRFYILVALYIVAFNFSWMDEHTGRYYLLNGLGSSSATTSSVLVVVFAIVGISGWLLRVWGASYIGSSTVHAREMRTDELVTCGPFSYSRNPLYLGSTLMPIGFFPELTLIGFVFLVVGTLLLLLYFISKEEDAMLKKYGDAFNKYRASVPKLFPRFKPFTGSDTWRPNWRDGLSGELPPIFIFATLTPLLSQSSKVVGLAVLGLFIAGLVLRSIIRPRQP
jgi:protein-S-isoprenylcysteine O-methyltransferase Ste14